MSLDIRTYDAAEAEGRIDLSFSEIMAFATTTFESLGFPTRIVDEREIPRYVDWNRDPGNQEYFRPGQFIRGPSVWTEFTPDEVRLVQEICDTVVELTRRSGGRAVRPLSSPLAMMGLFRIVSAVRAGFGGSPLSVFEVGPGSGYLGAALIREGHDYAAVDNTQALYLWQSRLFEAFGGARFSEWAEDSAPGPGAVRGVTHLPWWKYLRLATGPCPLKADVVVSNSNLGEMRPDALKYTVAVVKRLLEASKVKLFLYADVGYARESSPQAIEATLRAAGLVKVFGALFHGWVPEGHVLPAGLMSLERNIPLWNPSGDPDRLAAGDFMTLPPDQRPLDMDFIRVVEGWDPLAAPPRTAFLLEPRWEGAWEVPVLVFAAAFDPTFPASLVLWIPPDQGVDEPEALARLQEALAASGLERFPEIVLVSDRPELEARLQGYAAVLAVPHLEDPEAMAQWYQAQVGLPTEVHP